MGLSGLDIYKHLPKKNCKECGFPTCLAFAMQLAAKKVDLSKCPYVTEEAKKALESASQPPIRLVTIGGGENKLEVGNETVMFRHEETFYHPTGIGFLIEDSLPLEEIRNRILKINQLRFTRVGQKIGVDLIAVEAESQNKENFLRAVEEVLDNSTLNLLLISEVPGLIKEAVSKALERRPLIYPATRDNFEEMAKIAKEYSLPLGIRAQSLDELSQLTQKIVSLGVTDLVLDIDKKDLASKIQDLTQIRRQALKKLFRPLGYPTLSFTTSSEPYQEVMQACALVCKYSSIVIMRGFQPWQILPILTLRQNIFTDPQKPLQVESKVFEIGKVDDKSPILVTTNFSLTYFTVESEVEASKIPSYIITCDAEGLSVLTAWAAEKFTAESIAKTLKGIGIEERVSHREVIIPGYVAVLSGKLEEASGWKVRVGPKEAAGIPSYLKSLKSLS